MKIYTLEREQFVPRPLPEVFEYFNRPENLAKITPASLGFVILTPPPIVMRRGLEIDYKIKIAGIVPQRWTSVITEYDPPHSFVDEQKRGPYAYWRHLHRFEPRDGGTRVLDEVRYALPLGVLGVAAHAMFVRAQLDEIFRHRERVISGLFPPR